MKYWYTWISNTTSKTFETFIFDIHEYQTLQVLLVKYWYTWISNTASITGEILIYMNIKHYKYNWLNIDIHEYETLQV
jgi:hypothetical protein